VKNFFKPRSPPSFVFLFPLPSLFGAMSDQQSRQDHEPEPQDHEPEPQDDEPEPQDHEPEPQQHDGRMVAPPQVVLLIQIAAIAVELSSNFVMNHFAPLYLRTPYHTSALSGAAWVNELLTGHPKRIRNELGVYRGTFTILLQAMRSAGVQSSRHVSVEEQLSIFLYTVVTGLTCTHVGERFQRSSSTITK
jgi:hypothetical protein